MIKALIYVLIIQMMFCASTFKSHIDSNAPKKVQSLVEKYLNKYLQSLTSISLKVNTLSNNSLPNFLESYIKIDGEDQILNRQYILAINPFLTQDHIRVSKKQFKGAILRELVQIEYWESLSLEEYEQLQQQQNLSSDFKVDYQKEIDEKTLQLAFREGNQGIRANNISQWLSHFRLWQYKALLLNQEHLDATIEGYLTPRSINRWMRHNEPQQQESIDSQDSVENEN